MSQDLAPQLKESSQTKVCFSMYFCSKLIATSPVFFAITNFRNRLQLLACLDAVYLLPAVVRNLIHGRL